MNLDVFRPEEQTGDLLLSITRNCETVIKQTQKTLQKTLELRLTQPTETSRLGRLSILVLTLNG